MTTIAACRVGSTYALASDRRLTTGYMHTDSAEPKIRRVAPWLVLAWSGTSAAQRWLRATPEILREPSTRDAALAQLDMLADQWRTWAKDHNVTDTVLTGITPWGIVVMHTEGGMDLLASTVYGRGSGGEIAVGAMHALRDFHGDTLTAEAVAVYGVDVAKLYDIATGGPVDVLTIEAAP